MLPFIGPTLGDAYYSFRRPEILALIPLEARRILDVGCGQGSLGVDCKRRQDCFYAGIERDHGAFRIAEHRLDVCINADVETQTIYDFDEKFDVIIFSDVLEHLKNPLKTLTALSKYLAPDGLIIASIPNVGHPDILRELSGGLFRYVTAGILDNTHKRFFTPLSAQQLFVSAHLRVQKLIMHPSKQNAIQALITARPLAIPPLDPRLSILIPSWNNKKFVQSCILSLRQPDTPPAYIIVLDNGSADGTIDWLREQPDVLSIRAPINYGFTAGINLLLNCVTTELVFLSNVDVAYPAHSIQRLLAEHKTMGDLSIIGPSSCSVSGPQCIEAPKLPTFSALNNFSNQIEIKLDFTPRPLHRLVFFSVLFSMSLPRKIGFLDERFNPGNFEDDDYCLRAIEAGYVPYHIPNIFVYHFGGAVNFRPEMQFNKLMHRNKRLFLQKWGPRYKSIVDNFYAPFLNQTGVL